MTSEQAWAEAVLWVYGVFGIFWILQWWLGQHIQGLALLVFRRSGPASSIYFYLLAPGVIIHELSHWLLAKLLLVRTGDLALFRPNPRSNGKVTLGYVEVYKCDPLRQSIIGLAPLPVGILLLLLLSTLLGFNSDVSGQISSGNNFDVLTALPGKILASFGKPLNLLWLYLVFTISNGMLPSAPDRRPWLTGFILPGVVILGLILTGVLRLPDTLQKNLIGLLTTLTWIFAFAASLNLLFALLIAGFEFLISRFSRRRIVYRR